MESIEEAYQESLDFIYSFIDFSMKRHLDDAHRFFKLDRMIKLMTLLGNPQESFPCVHVAGTKGKGSTASLIASALRAAGYRVGLYTSPHLQEFTERIQINGTQIDKASLVDITRQLKPLTKKVPEVTSFELMTAMAFVYFASAEVEIAVIEVGLGGRLDATNIITPMVSVITPISYDHTAILGNTLTEIAAEKSGIIKPGVPVVLSPQNPEAQQELERIAMQRNAPLTLVDQAYQYTPLAHSLSSQEFSVQRVATSDPAGSLDSLVTKPLTLEIPLLGYHQVENAATAVAALDVCNQSGLSLTAHAIQSGFEHVQWPARFEILRRTPPVLIDSAHNGESMLRLRQTIEEYFPGQKFILLFGASLDKEMDAMLKEILPIAAQVITSESLHPRAANADTLADLIRPYGLPVQAITPAEDALEAALKLAGEVLGVLVTGSIFIAAAARQIWLSSRS